MFEVTWLNNYKAEENVEPFAIEVSKTYLKNLEEEKKNKAKKDKGYEPFNPDPNKNKPLPGLGGKKR